MMRLLCCLLLAALAGAAEPTDNVFTDVSTEVVTPHVQWMPLPVAHPLRVAVLAPAWGQRDTVELAERFGIQPLAVMTWTHAQFAGAAPYLAPDKVAARLDAVLAQPWDVMVIGGFDWQGLLLEHRAGILKRVLAGAGLVYVSPPDNPELRALWSKGPAAAPPEVIEGVPWSQLTAFKDQRPEEVVQAGTFGQGRWLKLNYRQHSTSQCLTPGLSPWPAGGAWEYEAYQMLLAKAVTWAAGRPMRAVPTDLTGRDVSVQRLPCDTVPSAAAVDCITALPDANGAVGWATRLVPLVEGVRILSLLIDRASYNPGDDVVVTVGLSRPLQGGMKLRLRLWGPGERLVGERSVTTVAAPLHLTAPAPLGGNVYRVVAEVVAGDSVLSVARAGIPIHGRERPDFHLAVWEEPEDDYVSALSYHRLRELGVDAVFYRADRGHRLDAARLIAEAGLWGAPSVPMYSPRPKPGPLGPEAPESLFDPAYQAKLAQAAVDSAWPFTWYDALFFPTGSDVSMRGNSFDRFTLAALREWLRKRYADLAALNRAWGSSFATWDDVVPESFAGAKAAGRFTSWQDHTRFMEEGFAAQHRRTAEALTIFDPHPLVGEDGFGRLDADDGADWLQILGASGFVNLYTYQDPPQTALVADLAANYPNVALRSLYYGSYDGQFGNLRFMRTIPWYALLHGYNGLFWWVANGKVYYPGTPNALLGPDFRATLSYETSRREIEAIRNGPAQLLAQAHRLDDGVAIYYDPTAVHAVQAYEHPSVLVRSLEGWQAALDDLGISYRYVAGPDLAKGVWPPGCRVLVMSHALALDEPTRQAIAKFVAGGGRVIADVAPGAYDGELKPATALTPAVLIQGLPDYPHQRTAAVRSQLTAALKPALGDQAVTLDVSGQPGAPGLQRLSWADGTVEYLGLVNDGPARRVTVRLKQPRRVYDLRGAGDLGEQQKWSVDLGDGETRFYALLSYQVSSLSLTPGPGATVTAQVVAAPAANVARHAVAFHVFDPRGPERQLYGKVVATDEHGQARLTLPLALNDPPGPWRVSARDVVSGRTAEAEVNRGQ